MMSYNILKIPLLGFFLVLHHLVYSQADVKNVKDLDTEVFVLDHTDLLTLRFYPLAKFNSLEIKGPSDRISMEPNYPQSADLRVVSLGVTGGYTYTFVIKGISLLIWDWHPGSDTVNLLLKPGWFKKIWKCPWNTGTNKNCTWLWIQNLISGRYLLYNPA